VRVKTLPIGAGTSAGVYIDESGDAVVRSENRDVNIDTLATTPTVETSTVTGQSSIWTGQGGGWRDMIGQVIARSTGPGNPAWTQMGSSALYAYAFDAVWFTFHVDHDHSSQTAAYLHAHWTTNGTSTNTVKWEFTYCYAKGHQQAAFDIGGGGTAVTVTQAATGTAWTHMISEISSGVLASTLETDGLILVRVKRLTNGGSENADTVFLLTSDIHYQADHYATKNKAPNFNE
jgi:hypothetical protein